MKSIWKYALPLPHQLDECTLRIPAGAHFLHMDMQRESPCLWMLVNPEHPPEERRFKWVATGGTVPPECETIGAFYGTVLLFGGTLVLHLFEVPPEER